jgi:hypothetical protein
MSEKHTLKAEQIAQADHSAVTPAALLARILALEEKADKPAKPTAPAKK